MELAGLKFEFTRGFWRSSLLLSRPLEKSCCLGNDEWRLQMMLNNGGYENIQCVLACALIKEHKERQ